MRDLYSNLLRLAISASLSDRERFIDKVSKIISDSMGTNPESSEHLVEGLTYLMQSLKDELFLRQVASSSAQGRDDTANKELIDQLKKLNETIAELNEKLNAK